MADKVTRLIALRRFLNLSGHANAMRQRMAGVCAKIPQGDPANATCRGFLGGDKTIKT